MHNSKRTTTPEARAFVVEEKSHPKGLSGKLDGVFAGPKAG